MHHIMLWLFDSLGYVCVPHRWSDYEWRVAISMVCPAEPFLRHKGVVVLLFFDGGDVVVAGVNHRLPVKYKEFFPY